MGKTRPKATKKTFKQHSVEDPETSALGEDLASVPDKTGTGSVIWGIFDPSYDAAEEQKQTQLKKEKERAFNPGVFVESQSRLPAQIVMGGALGTAIDYLNGEEDDASADEKASKNSQVEPDLEKLSEYLTSEVVNVMVAGKLDAKVFNIHSKVLARESAMLANQMRWDSKRIKKGLRVVDVEPDLFGYFVEYLYCGNWKLQESPLGLDKSYSRYVVLVRLYLMGVRLRARPFQCSILQELHSYLATTPIVSDEAVCQMLELVCAHVNEEDPMGELIFWSAASRLTSLQKYPCFRSLLNTNHNLAKGICALAGNTVRPQPEIKLPLLSERFNPERIRR